MSSLAKQKQEKQMNGYLLSFGVCAAAAFFIFMPFLVVDKGLFQYCGDFNSQQIPVYTYMNGVVKNSAGFPWCLCSCSSSAWRGWARIPI